MLSHLSLLAVAILPEEAVVPEGFGTTSKIVLALYLLVLLGIGFWGYRKNAKNEEDYYLAGRGQGWLVTTLTIMSTFFSSFALLSIPGLVYRDGVVFTLFALNVPFSGLCVYVLGSRIRRLGKRRRYVTPADMICDYYQDNGLLRVLVATVGTLYVVYYVVMQVQAGGLISEVLFPEVENAFYVGVVLLASVTTVYIMVGGMRSVAWTDALQGSLLVGAMLLTGFATIWALGGVGEMLARARELPYESLSVPGTRDQFPALKLFTICVFASMGSLIQPAQWMRFYAAKSTGTLARSSLLFCTVLPLCFLLGVMVVGFGGMMLYPNFEAGEFLRAADGTILPNPAVGDTAEDFDKIFVVLMREYLPAMMGGVGAVLASLCIVAIMAASMSTADSNLHAMSAVLTRDIYERFFNRAASEAEKVWVGRSIILVGTVIAVLLVLISRKNPHFDAVRLIAEMGFLAMAFTTQLVPATIDMLFLRRGSREGVIAGILAGLVVLIAFSPFLTLFVAPESQMVSLRDMINQFFDRGAWALIFNTLVFAIVSAVTGGRFDVQRQEAIVREMDVEDELSR